jgi:hypothetical protein
MDLGEAIGKALVMNSMLVEVAGGFLMHSDWIWGVIGLILGVLVEIAVNGKPARARASKARERK